MTEPQVPQPQSDQPQSVQPHTAQPYLVQESPPRGLSIASLVIGIISFFSGFTFIVPIIGLVLGIMGLRREPAGRGFALAGTWINAAILVVWAVITIIILVIAAAGLLTIPFLANS